MVNRYAFRSFFNKNEVTESAVEECLALIEPVFTAVENGNYRLNPERWYNFDIEVTSVIERATGIDTILGIAEFSVTEPLGKPGWATPASWSFLTSAVDRKAVDASLIMSLETKSFFNLYRGHLATVLNTAPRGAVETRLSGIVHANLPACPIGGVSSDLTRLAWLSVKTSVFAACLATMKNEPDAISMTRNVMRTLRSVIPIGPKRKPNYMWAVLAA